MQSVSSRIWTRVAVSISYDDNDYTTGTSRPCDSQQKPENLPNCELSRPGGPQSEKLKNTKREKST